MKQSSKKKVVVFDLWETLIFGTKDSAISLFHKEITGEEISAEQLAVCMLIKESEPRQFLEKFLERDTTSNLSSMILSLKNPRSPLHEKIVTRFNEAIENDFSEIRWVPGAIELLSKLKTRYMLVLASNLWAYQKKLLFERLGIQNYFDECLFSCDFGMKKDQILNDISSLLKVEKSRIVYVGRSYEYDILPAVNANISAVRITPENNIIMPEKLFSLIEEELDGMAGKTRLPLPAKFKSNTQYLIVIPPFYKLLGSHNNRLNLSATCVSSYLSAMGYANRIYHADSRLHENYITRYQMVFNSIEFYESLERDVSFKEFEAYYRENPADTVFVTCGDVLNPSFDSGSWPSTKKIAKIVRQINPKAYIVAMGPEVGNHSEDFDLTVYGEIESLLPLILKKRIRGKVSGTLIDEEKLQRYPLFDVGRMATEISPVSLDTIIWRRGCAGTCDFCRVAEINKGRIRYRSFNSVFQEIRERWDTFGIRNFYIVDANFTAHKERVMEFCKKMSREFPGINWRTESRFDTLDIELIEEMKKTGCTHLKLGLENSLNEMHQVRTKRVTLDHAAKWIRKIQLAGIQCVIYLMLGGKWFTNSQYREMFENARGLYADGYTISLYTPYPNTSAGISYEEWEKRKFIGSHLDIRLIDFWRIPIHTIDDFFALELNKGREDKDIRRFND